MSEKHSSLSRRDFLNASAATAALVATGNYAHAQSSDTIKVGLIGCGGRGTQAAMNAVEAAPNVEIVAMGDLFKDRLDSSKSTLQKNAGKSFKVTDDHSFVGFDAYKKVIASPVNYIILATPPGYRPEHLTAAVEAGKHVFFEKPVAVDAPGIRQVIAAGELAKQKGLSVVTGTQRRHQNTYLETIKRIHDGAIGELVSAQVYWNQGALWHKVRQPGQSDMEWQNRNWYYFTWLCGDHIVEQHVHNIDVANWCFNAHPVKAIAMGGRQQRVDPVYGHIWDHFAVEYEYPNGARVQSFCRHWENSVNNVSERIVGTKGTSNPDGQIYGETRYRYDGPKPNPYMVEHKDNIEAIRAGKPLNEARQVAESTLTAILGREAAYTGQEITWEQMLNCKTVLGPEKLDLAMSLPVPPVAIPGKTKLERERMG
jgi:predicted dehydrogenase